MQQQKLEMLREKINCAQVVSFDIFDTLLFRMVNTPEDIFDLVGEHFGIPGFRKIRKEQQDIASQYYFQKNQYPHADMDEIYEFLAKNCGVEYDWDAIKAYEIELEKESLVANTEMKKIYEYALSQGKKVVVTSDMYLRASDIRNFLEKNGYTQFDEVLVSSDERKAKFNGQLFQVILEKEHVEAGEVLHIGDNQRADVEIPQSLGFHAFHYEADYQKEKIKNALCSDVDGGLYKILYQKDKGFWYNLGIEVGGPLYLNLYLWFKKQIENRKEKIYFLARDGYNLYEVCKQMGMENAEYLRTSRRALIMAGITEMNETDVELLPPYTFGQTVEEVLNYLGIAKEQIKHLGEAGFESFEDRLDTVEDLDKFKEIYVYDKEVFLEQCRKEREAAKKYFEEIGFLDGNALVFDCGWNGSSQYLMDRFLETIDYKYKNEFYYVGIFNTEKSKKQLRGRKYATFLFDFYKNYMLQAKVKETVVLFELFFSANHPSVKQYTMDGIIYEETAVEEEKQLMLQGILDYVKLGAGFVEKHQIYMLPDMAIGRLERLIHNPTEEEAVAIGNLSNADGFVSKKGEKKFIAYISDEQMKNNPGIELFWLQGILKRSDISENVKKTICQREGKVYPPVEEEISTLEDSYSIQIYQKWIKKNERKQEEEILAYQPLISVVVPVYNIIEEQLRDCVDSILGQTYHNFELILVDDHSSWENVRTVLREYEANEKVSVIYRETNGHISEATNDGIHKAQGEYIAFMDCDDVIATNALYEMAKKLNENRDYDFIYSDEDKLTEDGSLRHMPFFKPDWSPDLFFSLMYTNHLAIYRAKIVKEIGGLRSAFNGAQDYDMTLRFMEHSSNERVGHIPKVLYYWRERKESLASAPSAKSYALTAVKKAKEEALKRRNIAGHMEYISDLYQYRVVYDNERKPLVSIIIPSKDHPEILMQCVDSVIKYTTYPNYEILVVDNGSNDKNRQLIDAYLSERGCSYLYEKMEFNFAHMCNMGAEAAKGEYLLFLNDDIEIFQNDWMDRMVGHASQQHVGAVGIKLFYPITTLIQHTGVVNLEIGPSHTLVGLDDRNTYYFGRNRVDLDFLAVTAACLIVAKSKFEEIDGFDESFAVAYNDVDLCFKLYKKGYYNVVRTDVVAYHHESVSRGIDHQDKKKLVRLYQELMRLYCKHMPLKQKDPFYSINLLEYGNECTIRNYADEVTVTSDKPVCPVKGIANIDFISRERLVRISGWSVLPERNDNNELKRKLVLRNDIGDCLEFELDRIEREDVMQALEGGEDIRYSGFLCNVNPDLLRTDLMEYRISVITVLPNGTEVESLSNEKVQIMAENKNRELVCDFEPFKEEHLTNDAGAVVCILDEVNKDGVVWKIRGFAFADKNAYRYKKYIVLKPLQGEAIRFATIDEERRDVVIHFAEKCYLLNSGFVCNILEDCLQQAEYEIGVLLQNRYTGAEQLIMTGHMLKEEEIERA